MHLSFFLKPLFIFSAISAVSAASNDLVKRDDGPGAPGTQCYADPYNSLGNDWNKTYGATEPQQLHMSWMDESNYARIQFATLDKIEKSVLVYWPKTKGHSKKQTKINGSVNDDAPF
jgi:hypothetical protein